MVLQPQSFRFSTQGLPQRERADAVRSLSDRGILPIEPLPGKTASVDIAKWFLPGLGILSGTFGGLRQDGTAHAASDDVFLGLNVRGHGTLVQRGREITLGDGDAFLVNVTAGAFTICRPGSARFIGLRVPRKAIEPLVPDLADDSVRLIARTTGSLSLLVAYVNALLGSRALAAPESARLVVTHVHDLIGLSLGAIGSAAAAADDRSIRAVRLRTIKADIVANLEDERLTLAAVAARQHVTPRYIHRLFEREGITYTQFVLRQRLERAYRLLRDPRFAAWSISAIAYEAGFGDLSYFNRAFRRHYQRTPSDVKSGDSW